MKIYIYICSSKTRPGDSIMCIEVRYINNCMWLQSIEEKKNNSIVE